MPIQVSIFVIIFILTLLTGKILIPVLQKLKVGQVVRDDGPKTHFGKAGTPTMGGIIFLIPFVLVCGAVSFLYSGLLPLALVTVFFGLVGFADDYTKIVLKRSKGLSAKQKMAGLIIVSTLFVLYLYQFTNVGTSINIPFTDRWLDLGLLYIPFTILVLLATTNSINLTDGLDGLAAGVSLIITVFFAVTAILIQNISIAVFCAGIAGGCLGFMAYNIHPAKVFMGDTGALALGGVIAISAIVLRMPLMLFIVAGIPVAETLSDIIQVVVYKKTGKRVFKMAPLHHHFELSGWNENKIVLVFWGVTLVLCVLGYVSISNNIF